MAVEHVVDAVTLGKSVTEIQTEHCPHDIEVLQNATAEPLLKSLIQTICEAKGVQYPILEEMVKPLESTEENPLVRILISTLQKTAISKNEILTLLKEDLLEIHEVEFNEEANIKSAEETSSYNVMYTQPIDRIGFAQDEEVSDKIIAIPENISSLENTSMVCKFRHI